MIPGAPQRTARWAALAAALAVVLSAAGLLCLRLGVYDDSLLLLGARLVRAGQLPYRDFYTHYGPLGFGLLAVPMKWIANPGVALRLAQGFGLAGVTLLFGLALRRLRARPGTFAAAGAVLAFSAAMAQSAFIGFGLAAASVALYLAARETSGSAAAVALAASGALLAGAAWTRPAFAVYVGVALLWLELVAGSRASRRTLVLTLAAALAAAAALWLIVYRSLDPATVAEATLLAPARLMTLGQRTLLPDFTRSGAAISLLVGAAVAAAPIAWSWSLPSRASRLASTAAIALGAILPLALRPGRSGWTILLLLISLAANAGLAVLHRESLRGSPRVLAAAALGLSASAFGHYFWSRPDPQHLFPMLALASASVLFVWDRWRIPMRAAVVALFAIPFVPIGPGRETALPIFSLWKGGLARVAESSARPGASLLTVWPAGEVPSHAAAAVMLADRLSSPTSRFVAYGTNQSQTAGNPVYLFLLSRRLPYTHWFQYDPGLQSSPAVQEQMIGELAASESAAAVVWRSESFTYDDLPEASTRSSPFDDEANRIYGRVVGRFGNYEVRVRDGADRVPESP